MSLLCLCVWPLYVTTILCVWPPDGGARWLAAFLQPVGEGEARVHDPGELLRQRGADREGGTVGEHSGTDADHRRWSQTTINFSETKIKEKNRKKNSDNKEKNAEKKIKMTKYFWQKKKIENKFSENKLCSMLWCES